MPYLDPVFIPIIIVGIGAVLFFYIFFIRKKDSKERKPRTRDRNAVLREANRRLAQNPKDSEALLSLGDLYYKENQFDKSFRTYEILIDLCATNPDLDEFDITKKYALSALRLKKYEEAYKNLILARTLSGDDFEVNSNLGFLEYKRKNYEKAASLLQNATSFHPEHVRSLRYLGHSQYKLKRHKEALTTLRKTIDLEPDDKESLFETALCYYALGQNEQALNIFTHLRTDPQLGPSASLYAGTVHLNNHQYEQAALDFEIGLRHESIKAETKNEIQYRLGAAYIKQQDLASAVKTLSTLQETSPGYKDVPSLLEKYSELNSNRNLQTFLISVPSEFVSLCRKITEGFIPKARIKITNISLHKSEYADILAEVSTSKWEDLILFRFIRTTGQTGELVLRDLYSHIKDVKAGRGFCITAGEFTDGAKQFVEARLIDLIEKDDLMKKLKNLKQ